MTVSRYLVVALVITLGLVIWSQLNSDEESVREIITTDRSQKNIVSTAGNKVMKEESIVDLFPIHIPEKVQAQNTETPQSMKKKDPVFPLQVVGAWWENGIRIIILSDGELNLLLCKQCTLKGTVHPGEAIITEWRLIALSEDHIMVEWQPEHMIKKIKFGNLTPKPGRII